MKNMNRVIAFLEKDGSVSILRNIGNEALLFGGYDNGPWRALGANEPLYLTKFLSGEGIVLDNADNVTPAYVRARLKPEQWVPLNWEKATPHKTRVRLKENPTVTGVLLAQQQGKAYIEWDNIFFSPSHVYLNDLEVLVV